MKGWRCRVQGWLDSLAYWINGGSWGWSVSGHTFGEPTFRRTVDDDGHPIEVEVLTCRRCGATSEGWRPIPWDALTLSEVASSDWMADRQLRAALEDPETCLRLALDTAPSDTLREPGDGDTMRAVHPRGR